MTRVATFVKLLTIVVISLTATPVFADSIYTVTVDSSSLVGTSADLAFDLVNGGSASNSVRISNFSANGTLGVASPTGSVTGTLPEVVTLADSPSSFFNEYLTQITLGSTFSFTYDATENGATSSSLPDSFSMSLLDPNTGLPLFPTDDPTGANTLFTLNIDGSSANLYSALVTATPQTSASEPSSMLFLGSGLCFLSLGLGLRRRRRSGEECKF